MQCSFRRTHLVIGAATVIAFLVTGLVMYRHAPALWSMVASLLALAGAVLCFFAFFAEPMGGRPPGVLSAFGLYSLFGGVVLYAAANARSGERQSA